MNTKEKIESVISEAYADLSLLQDNCFIIGSSALILSGIKIENTYDIDILTSDKNANHLKQLWKERSKPDHVTQRDDLFRSNFSRYDFGPLDIEVMGDLEVNKNGKWTPLIIKDFIIFRLNHIQIKLPTLTEQIRIYNFFGREKDKEKISLIEKKL